ncbi:acyltransferase family protein [Oryzobacter telluris]|uniref:acyltransferase family protein n=1 Tax=Oryzobacter telluris TaxID=3149179 RepID=UPI00370DAE8F
MAPTPRTARLAGLDLARGLAVVSMLVAHLSPVGGLFDVSEYLTAPLFAVVIGVAMGVQLDRRHPGVIPFLVANLQRGLVLVVLGLVLQLLYGQIVVVLPYLGLLVLVLAPLALLLHRAPVLTLGLAAGGAVLGPLVTERAREAGPAAAAAGTPWPGWWSDLSQWLATGSSYRLTSFVPMALGGLALAAIVRRVGRGPFGWAVAGVLVVASGAVYLVGGTTADGAAAYSGTTAEVLGATLLAASVVVASFVVDDQVGHRPAGRALGPLLATGRLALTAYTVQIVALAAISLVRGRDLPDDTWPILLGTTAVVVATCWALDRWWGTGPLEWVLHRIRPQVPEGRHRTP